MNRSALLIATACVVGLLAGCGGGASSSEAVEIQATRARVAEGLELADEAKIAVADVLASGNPQASAAGYATGWVAPAATANVVSVSIVATTGVITVTTTPAAGNGTLTITPYTSPGGAPSVLPVGTATFTPPTAALQWQCRAAGSAVIAPGSVAGTLPAKYAPASCQ